MENMKIIKYLEDSGLLLKGVSETIQNKVREQKGRFLGTSLLGNMLTGKGINRTEDGIIRAGYGSSKSESI